jgi:imidazolonepropionase-like amidohydrolase
LNGGEAAFKLVRAARLIDGISDRPSEGGAVLLQGAKIVAVGPQAAEAPPEGAQVKVFDYPDATVMPGMVDCHTHHNGFGDGRLGDDLALLPD